METKEINSKIITEIDGSKLEVFKMETSEEKLFELFPDEELARELKKSKPGGGEVAELSTGLLL